MFSLEASQRCFHSTKFNFILFLRKNRVWGKKEKSNDSTVLYVLSTYREQEKRGG